MLAYHNDVKIKENILKQLQAHYDADEIIKGIYWENGKRCAVGCTLHSTSHEEYEERFGIPAQIAYLENRIFETIPNNLAKQWPIKFISSINIGADLSKVWPKFAIWLLSDSEYGVLQYTKDDKTKKYIQDVIDLYQKKLTGNIETKKFKSAVQALVNTFYPIFTTNAAYYAARAANAADYADVAATAAATAAATDYELGVKDWTDFMRKTKLHYIAQSKKLLDILKNTF